MKKICWLAFVLINDFGKKEERSSVVLGEIFRLLENVRKSRISESFAWLSFSANFLLVENFPV